MNNTAALGVPTFAREAFFGTNPIAVSAPAAKGHLFTLDMATTAVTRGKIEVCEREGLAMPHGWAVAPQCAVTSKAHQLLQDMLVHAGGGLLPLGGATELFGGHKGYGLAVLVDILTAVASGGEYGGTVQDSEETSASVCHFFGAVKIDLFRNPEHFKEDLGNLLDSLTEAVPAEGHSRVYYAGLKEHEAEILHNRIGIPLTEKVFSQLEAMSLELKIPFDLRPKT